MVIFAHSLVNMVGGDMEYHSWQKQERFKGRFGVNVWLGNAGTSEMGWGFSTQGYYGAGTPPLYRTVVDPTDPQNIVIVRISPYGTNDAANASTVQLRIDPVFNHDPPIILSGNLQPQDVDELLARGVPALSGPVESMELENHARNRQADLNDIADVVGWPHVNDDDWQGWRHSDIKNVAMPFVHDVFETILGTVQP